MSEPSGVIQRLLEELAELPGIGPKSAERIAHFLLSGDRKHAVGLAEALMAVAEKIRPCKECFNLTDQELCPVCSDPRRDGSVIAWSKTPRDVTAFETSREFPRALSRARRAVGSTGWHGSRSVVVQPAGGSGAARRGSRSDPGDEPDTRRRRDGLVRLESVGGNGCGSVAIGARFAERIVPGIGQRADAGGCTGRPTNVLMI